MCKNTRDNIQRGKCFTCGRMRYLDKMIWLDGHWYCHNTHSPKDWSKRKGIHIPTSESPTLHTFIHDCCYQALKVSTNRISESIKTHNEIVTSLLGSHADQSNLKLKIIHAVTF
jgi:hypothetical protein